MEFPGPLFDEKQLRSELMRAGLFVYPSLAERGETFGLAPLEAMSCGCPPLVSSLDCFTDFIEDGVDGFKFDHNKGNPADSLHLKLKALLEEPELVNQMRLPALRKASKFTAPVVADAYLADFLAVLRERS